MAKQTFTSGQVLTAAEMNSLQENDYNWTVTTKTASYTLAAGDEGTRIVMDNAGATTITVDDAIFSAGDVVWIHNIGAGTCTITAGTATVTTIGNLALEQYAGGHLYFTSASAAIFFPTDQGGPRGQIAVASSGADFLATTGGLDIIDTSVTLTSSRILKISYYTAITNPSTNLQISIDVRDAPVATATVQYQSATASLGTAADSNIISLSGIYSATFAAGTHDFYLIATTSTGTAILNGSSAGRFHFLIVDDMGAG